MPYWWTPAANASFPSPGCVALVDLANDTAGAPLRAAPRSLNGTFGTELTQREAVRLIAAHPAPAVPLFLLAAFHAVHDPLEAPEADVAPFAKLVADRDRRVLGGMVAGVDRAVGAMRAALEARGMWEDTLVVVTTDNGGPVCLHPDAAHRHYERIEGSCGTNNWPLRGSKMTLWQGGVRGVALMAGGRVPKAARGGVYPGMLHQVDLYATLLARAGVSAAELNSTTGPVPPDGVDVWAAVTGGLPSPRTELVHNIDGARGGSIRVGDWKLIVGYQGAGQAYNGFDGWWKPPEMGGASEPSPVPRACAASPCLFNVADDPEERRDRAQGEPAVLARLLKRYAELKRTEVTREAAGLCVEVPDGCVANMGSGVWQPWV